MKNLKIRAKLFLGFGVVIATLVLIGIIGVLNLNTTSNDITYITKQIMPDRSSAWMIRRDLVSIERNMYKAIANEDPELTKKYIAEVSSDSETLFVALDDLMTSYDGDKSKLQEASAQIDNLKVIGDRVTALASELTEEANTEAGKILEEEFSPTFETVNATITTVFDDINARGDERATKADNSSSIAVVLLIIVTILAIIPAVVFAVVIANGIARPITACAKRLIALSKGDLKSDVPHNDSKDEIGMMVNALADTVSGINVIISDVDFLLSSMANGNFDINTKVEGSYVGDFMAILVSMRNINVNLSNTLSQINEASEQVSSGSDQVSSGAQALSQGATEQASAIEELSASITEISEAVRTNAVNANAASTKASDAGVEISGSNDQMKDMISAMNDITDKSNEIGKIIKTIDDIAFQTNILALNAAVEAARAGAAGKGFAVVADEVRNLAGKSAEAAKNTTSLIEETVNAVKNGSEIANQTAERLSATVSVAQEAVTLIDEIARSSADQATSINQVTQGVDQISAVVQTNSATAEESAAASEELSTQATMLKQLVGKFSLRSDSSKKSSYSKSSYSSSYTPSKVVTSVPMDSNDKY